MLMLVAKKNKYYVSEYRAINIKVNINKYRVIFTNLQILKTTKYLSKATDFNRKSAVYEKK